MRLLTTMLGTLLLATVAGSAAWCIPAREEYQLLYLDLSYSDTLGYRSHFDQIQGVARVEPSTLQGALLATGDPSDLAILGDGYFLLFDDEGTPFLSRTARLVVQGTTGFKLVTSPLSSPFRSAAKDSLKPEIHGDGLVFLEGKPVGQIKLYETSTSNITGVIGNRIYVSKNPDPKLPGGWYIISGASELSTVDLSQTLDRMLVLLGSPGDIERAEEKAVIIKRILSSSLLGIERRELIESCLPPLELLFNE